MNERIGTFCEKCREVVCRCAEHEANLQKATDNVVRYKPNNSFSHWIEFLLGGSEESMKMKEEPITWDEISSDFTQNYQVAKFVEFLKQNYEPPKKKIR